MIGLTTLAATALTCVAMFHAQQEVGNDAVFLTDGKSTRQVFDLDNGVGRDGEASFFTNPLNYGTVMFSGYSYRAGREIWTSDGTSTGTRLLRDIFVGANFSSYPAAVRDQGSVSFATALTSRFQVVGNRVVFGATSSWYGRELWSSDGTAAGTYMIRDHVPGGENGIDAEGGPPEFVYSNGSFAIYLAKDPSRGKSLWATRGLRSDSVYLGPYNDVSSLPLPYPFGAVGNRLLYAKNERSELWATDGTVAGTRRVAAFGKRTVENISRIPDLNFAIFSVYGLGGHELWITDGTPTQTRAIKNISPQSDSNPGDFMPPSESQGLGAYFRLGHKILFPANDNVRGRELWVTQGSASTTVLLADLTTGMYGSEFHQFVRVGNLLYFTATVKEFGFYNRRLFVTDGTTAGTKKLSTSISPYGRIAALRNGVVFFGTSTTSGQNRIWYSGPVPNSQTAVSGAFDTAPWHFQSVNIPTSGANAPCPVQ